MKENTVNQEFFHISKYCEDPFDKFARIWIRNLTSCTRKYFFTTIVSEIKRIPGFCVWLYSWILEVIKTLQLNPSLLYNEVMNLLWMEINNTQPALPKKILQLWNIHYRIPAALLMHSKTMEFLSSIVPVYRFKD